MRNNFLIRPLSLNTDLATLLLRLIFGGLMVFHGYEKIEAYNTYVNVFPDFIGIGGKLSYNLVIFAEFFCGILIVLGLFTRLAVIPLMVSFPIAYFMAHEQDTFDKKELVFLFMLLTLPVFILGSGRYSVDRAIFRS